MVNAQDPEDVAQYVIGVVHRALNLVPGAKVMVLIARPDSAQPDGLFSQMSYDRAVSLLQAAQATTAAANSASLETIARAMRGRQHG